MTYRVTVTKQVYDKMRAINPLDDSQSVVNDENNTVSFPISDDTAARLAERFPGFTLSEAIESLVNTKQ